MLFKISLIELIKLKEIVFYKDFQHFDDYKVYSSNEKN